MCGSLAGSGREAWWCTINWRSLAVSWCEDPWCLADDRFDTRFISGMVEAEGWAHGAIPPPPFLFYYILFNSRIVLELHVEAIFAMMLKIHTHMFRRRQGHPCLPGRTRCSRPPLEIYRSWKALKSREVCHWRGGPLLERFETEMSGWYWGSGLAPPFTSCVGLLHTD